MIVISNSSPLIVLSAVDRLDILSQLFDIVYIPDSVYQETVQENHVLDQKTRIENATNAYIHIRVPEVRRIFTRTLGAGEQGVLNLALEMHPDILLLDDKKARYEAKALGFTPIFTTDIFKWAEVHQIIESYHEIISQLAQYGIYLPD
jgi:predicted nucleic acid-binding protein